MNQDNLETLLATDYKLIALETDSKEKSVNDFRPLVRDGKAIYLWENNQGLSRMEASHIHIPNTRTPEMVLNHIMQSKLYGVYLLLGFNEDLSRPALQATLHQIAGDVDSHKTVIFIDNEFSYPQTLMSKLLLTQEPELRARLSYKQIA